MTEQEPKLKFYNDVHVLNQRRKPYSIRKKFMEHINEVWAERLDEILLEHLCDDGNFS